MNNLARWPGIVLAVAVTLGIIASMAVPWIAAAAALAALAAAVLLRRRVAGIVAAGVLAGTVSAWLQRPAALSDSGLPADGTFTATVESASTGPNSQRVLADIDAPRPFRAELRVADCDYTLLPGEKIEFLANFSPALPADVLLAGGATTRDFRLLACGAGATARVDAVRSVGFDNSLRHKAGRLAHRMADGIYDTGFSPATSALLAGAFFGGDYADTATRDAFRASGVAHLLCISGFHVALIAAALGFLLYPLRANRRLNLIRRCLIIAAVWLYALLAGLQPSAVRAAAMLTVLAIALSTDRTQNSPNALGITVAALLIAAPYWLFSIGFQLSVAAVAGLMCFFGKLNPVSPRRHVLFTAAGWCVAPPAAMAGVFPLLLFYFHGIPLAGFVTGIAGAVVFPLFMVGGGLTALLGAVGVAPAFMVRATDAMAEAMDTVCGYAGALPWNMQLPLYPGVGSAVCVLAAVIVLGVLLHHRRLPSRLGLATVAVALAVAAVAFAYVPENS